MIRTRMLAATLVIGLSGNPLAADIPLSPADLDNLGIRFVSPALATETAGIEATARVVIPPAGDAVVSAPQTGLLATLNVAVGDTVEAGQVLAELSSPEFIGLQREFLDALNTHLLAQNELMRDQQLFDEGIISKRRLQETLTKSRIAESGFNEHRQLLKIAGLYESDIGSLEEDQELFVSLRIRAPFDGVIVDRTASTGQQLDAMSPIYRLADLSELWLEINVPQELVAGIQPGAKVSVAHSAGEHAALVTTVGRAIDPSTQSITVRARLAPGRSMLSPGQFVAVRIMVAGVGGPISEIRKLPASAVTRSGDAWYAFVRNETGVEVRQVEVVSMNSDTAYVAGGLDDHDAVAESGVSVLKALWSAQDET